MAETDRDRQETIDGSPITPALVLLWAGLLAAAAGSLVGAGGGWLAMVLLSVGLATTWAARAGVANARGSLTRRTGRVMEDLDALIDGPTASPAPVWGAGWAALDRNLRRLEAVPARVGGSLDRAATNAEALLEVLASLDEPVLVIDGEGVVRIANGAAAGLIGSREQAIGGTRLVGSALEDVFPQRELGRIVADARRHETGRARGRTRFAIDATMREHEASAMLITGDRVVLVLRDITELSRAVQLKTDFVANASHELRTPLASIRAAAETLEGLGGDDAAMIDRLGSLIGQNVARLEEMVRDLLDLSRLEAPDFPVEPDEVDVAAMLEGLHGVFGDIGRERSVELDIDVPAACASIVTDRRLLELVLRNLIDNAMKFAYPETAVRVRVRAGEADVRGRRPVVFEVRDRGLGIPLEQQQRVFERYYQVDLARTGDSRARGTGLGLAIVKHALVKLGGDVSLDSEWRKGTRVRVELPGAIPPRAEVHSRDAGAG